MKTKPQPAETPAPAAQEEVRLLYKVTAVPPGGTLKLGGVRAMLHAEVRLTKAVADALNAETPGTLTLLGV